MVYEPGCYWVCFRSEWTIARFDPDRLSWEIVACDEILQESDFSVIGPYLPPPDSAYLVQNS